MARRSDSIILLGGGALAADVTRRLAEQSVDRRILTIATARAEGAAAESVIDPSSSAGPRMLAERFADVRPSRVVVLSLSQSPQTPSQPWLHDRAVADMVVFALGRCAEAGVRPPSLLVLSSTAVYGVAARSPLMFHEQSPVAPAEDGSTCARWIAGLRSAEQTLLGMREVHRVRVGILRAAPVLGGPVDSMLEALLRAAMPVRVLGYDPPVQSLAYDDLVHAVVLALEQDLGEVLNIVGRSVVPLSRLLAMAGVFAPALPGVIADRVAPAAFDPEHLRWRTVADGRRAMQVLGFRPERSLEESLRARR